MSKITCENTLLQGTLFYDQTPLLSYQINYPQFFDEENTQQLKSINDYYSDKALALENYCKTRLMDQAIEQYRQSLKQDVPMDPYELVQKYNITDLTDELLSLYYDQYVYTGGAHGATERYSNVWKLSQGSILRLCDFFPMNTGYVSGITAAIIQSVSRQMARPEEERRCLYFDDYKEKILSSFNENNFYLTPDGVVVYFQQYDIAPYYCGIPQFLAPYAAKF